MSDLAYALATAQERLRPWAASSGVACWRILHEPCIVDWYDGEAVAWQVGELEPDAAVIAAGLGIVPERVQVKLRRRQKERQQGGQYQKLDATRSERTVLEHGLRFAVNLHDYLDTGLFLDHRPLRRQVRGEAAGKRVLNLFAYTGSFTVHAAAGGAASTTTVDLSNTYLRWAGRNLDLNRIRGRHELVKADCIRWLGACTARFDLIVCDPPTFSNSKAMMQSWEVERDQGWLLWRLWNLLAPGGTAYFSTNKRGFRLAEKLPPFAEATDITAATIDPDFAGTEPHRCWRLRR